MQFSPQGGLREYEVSLSSMYPLRLEVIGMRDLENELKNSLYLSGK